MVLSSARIAAANEFLHDAQERNSDENQRGCHGPPSAAFTTAGYRMLGRSLERILVNNQVRVFAHPNFDPMCKGNQEKLRPLSPGEFHCGNEVAVCGDQDDHLRLMLQRQAGDVESNPHVNALLPNTRHDVGGFDFHAWTLLAQYLWLEMPALVK